MITRSRIDWKKILNIPASLSDSDGDGIYENLKVLWSLVQNKPSTFPPSSHTHNDSDLLGIDWSKVLNKPSAFPPSAHSHTVSEITDLTGNNLKLISSANLTPNSASIDLTSIHIHEGFYLFMYSTKGAYNNFHVLLPNGISYSQQFHTVQRYWNGSDQNKVEEQINDNFICGVGNSSFSICFISNMSFKKSIVCITEGNANDNDSIYHSFITSVWFNTSDAWTSMGIFENANSSNTIYNFNYSLYEVIR